MQIAPASLTQWTNHCQNYIICWLYQMTKYLQISCKSLHWFLREQDHRMIQTPAFHVNWFIGFCVSALTEWPTHTYTHIPIHNIFRWIYNKGIQQLTASRLLLQQQWVCHADITVRQSCTDCRLVLYFSTGGSSGRWEVQASELYLQQQAADSTSRLASYLLQLLAASCFIWHWIYSK